MKKEDEAELQRLCDVLKEIDRQCESSPKDHEALAKAALALHQVFIQGNRSEIESHFDRVGKTLLTDKIHP